MKSILVWQNDKWNIMCQSADTVWSWEDKQANHISKLIAEQFGNQSVPLVVSTELAQKITKSKIILKMKETQ